MALLLETVWGDLVIDLKENEIAKNYLKLAKARQFTKNLIYQVHATHCITGCPKGDGSGGASVFAYIDSEDDSAVESSPKRFLKSLNKTKHFQRGDVVAVEVQGVKDTVGSQFAIVLQEDPDDLEGVLIGHVSEDDQNVLEKLASAYCDPQGRPYADVRILRALVVHDPFEDPPGLEDLLERRGVKSDEGRVIDSPSPIRPQLEKVHVRIQADEVDDEEDPEVLKKREMEAQRKEDRGRAVVLEMLGDLPDADIKAPENVLFICKLNPATEDEDLELIFSRFDPNVKVEIIRDQDTGRSLQYAFAEFAEKKQAVEAYFKMNNALIDDRRIKVDFSQSVAKIWDKYNQKFKMPSGGHDGSFGLDTRQSGRQQDRTDRRSGGGYPPSGRGRNHNGPMSNHLARERHIANPYERRREDDHFRGRERYDDDRHDRRDSRERYDGSEGRMQRRRSRDRYDHYDESRGRHEAEDRDRYDRRRSHDRRDYSDDEESRERGKRSRKHKHKKHKHRKGDQGRRRSRSYSGDGSAGDGDRHERNSDEERDRKRERKHKKHKHHDEDRIDHKRRKKSHHGRDDHRHGEGDQS